MELLINEFLTKHNLPTNDYRFINDFADTHNICYLTLSGSRAYGTNTDTSDVDIRGIAFPNESEIYGLENCQEPPPTEVGACIGA